MLAQGIEHLARERVQPRGPVERDHARAVVLFEHDAEMVAQTPTPFSGKMMKLGASGS